MITGRTFVAAAGLLLILLLVMWWLTNPPESHFLPPKYVPPPAETNFQSSATQAASPSGGKAGVTPGRGRATPPTAASAGAVVWPGAMATSKIPNRPDQSSREDIDAIHAMISNDHAVFGEVPPSELQDRWSTPYFLHRLTRGGIDLRSSEPALKLWIKDDVFEEIASGTHL